MQPHPPTLGAGWRFLASVLLGSATLASTAAAQDVRYTILPSASHVWWDDALGLERTTLVGGRAGVDFGPFVGLEGFFLTRGGLAVRLDDRLAAGVPGVAAGDGDVDVTNYGLGVRFNFGERRIAPFLRGGASVFDFRPDGGEAARFLALTYGGGLRLNLTPRVRAQLFAEDARLRVDRAALAPPGAVGADPDRDDLRRNLSVGAGLGVVLGPPLLRDTGPRPRWNVASFPIEPFAGRLQFAAAELPAQSLAGIRAGVDAGALVGLRGYYWRGVTSNFGAVAPMQSLGGEVQFNLNAAPHLAPYLVLGGGTLDFRDAYRDDAGAAPEDKTVAILGGGIGLRLTDQFRLNAAVRDYVYARASDLGDATRASDLEHNWLFSAGVTLNVGRGRRGIRIVRQPTAADSAATLAAAPVARRDTLLARDRSRDTVFVSERDGRVLSAEEAGRYVSGRTVTIPVPIEGELYVRYGPLARASSGGGLVLPSGDSVLVRIPRAALQGLGATRDPIDTAAATLVVPLRRDASGALVADSAALRSAIRRLVEEERRGATLLAPVGDSVARPPAAGAAASMPSPQARVDATLAERGRADSLFVRDLVQREVERRLDAERRQGAPAAAPPAAAGVAPPPTVVVRDDPVGIRPIVAPVPVASPLAGDERTRAEVTRLRARVDSLQATRDDSAAMAAREELRQAEAAAARADVEQARLAAREAERRAADAERERLDALRRLERLVADVADVRETERGPLVVLGDGAFATGQASLAPRALGALGVVAAALAQQPADSIVVSGHTDASGGAAANLRLSERRAIAVRDALVAYGVAPARIVVRSFGEAMPVADNATPDGRARNRRAEILLVGARRLGAGRTP